MSSSKISDSRAEIFSKKSEFLALFFLFLISNVLLLVSSYYFLMQRPFLDHPAFCVFNRILDHKCFRVNFINFGKHSSHF